MTDKVNFYNAILGGNIPLNVLECFKGFDAVYNSYTLAQHPYLKIKNETAIELNILECNESELSKSKQVCRQHIKKSLNLNRDMIINSLQIFIKKIMTQMQNKYKEQLDKYKNNKDNTIINDFYNEFSNKMLNDFKRLNMEREANDLLLMSCLIISLGNLNTQAINNLMFKIGSYFDLNTPFMMNEYIGTTSKFLPQVKKFIDENIDIDIFSAELGNNLLTSLEFVLNHIIVTTVKSNICKLYIYAISIADSIVSMSSVEKFTTIETFFDIGSEKNITTNTSLFKLNETQKKIDQSKVLEGLKKLITNSVTEALSKNTSELAQSLNIINNITIQGVKSDTISLKNIKQKNDVKVEGDMDTVQNITNKINNDIQNKIIENVDMMTKDQSEKIDKSVIDMKKGTNISDITKDIANILSVSIGSTTNMTTNEDITDIVRDTFNLDQSFKYKRDENNVVDLKNKFNNEQLNKCSGDKDVSNVISIIDTESRLITAEDIEQSNVIEAITKCTFNQTVLNDITNKVLNEFDNIIKQSIESARKEVDESKRANTIGDIYATGTAVQQTLEGAATFTNSIANVFKSTGGMILAIAIGLGLVALIGFFFYKKVMSGDDSSDDLVDVDVLGSGSGDNLNNGEGVNDVAIYSGPGDVSTNKYNDCIQTCEQYKN